MSIISFIYIYIYIYINRKQYFFFFWSELLGSTLLKASKYIVAHSCFILPPGLVFGEKKNMILAESFAASKKWFSPQQF